MVALKKSETINITNRVEKNKSFIYVGRLANATNSHTAWSSKHKIYWSKYQIKESDMRVKTATFTSANYFDLTTGVYVVLITSPYHEDFGGVILSVKRNEDTGLYDYQCQDFTRQYQSKIDLVSTNLSYHRLLKHLITNGKFPLKGDTSKAHDLYKTTLSGLRPAYQYYQKYWGSTVKFNPMTQTAQVIIRGKTLIEAIRALAFGNGAYIDVYANKYGVLQIEPYHKTDWLNTGLHLKPYEIMKQDISFDTTNIITNVNVEASNKLETGKEYSSATLLNKLDLSAFFGSMGESISNPNENTTTTTAKASNSTNKKSVTGKKSTSTKNNNNPYGKPKKIYLNTDNIYGKKTDRKFLNDIAKKLKKKGWKTKIIGVGPNTHTETYARNCKNGIWFCVYGGADGAVFRECSRSNSYTKTLKKNNLRTVIGMRAGCDIRKGGKCYKYLRRAWDDNYSPSSYRGISYPLNMLTKAKVPIMYASTADKMVAKFLKGGDNPKAC